MGQILAASALLGENLIYTYLPVLLLAGIATGVLTAAVERRIVCEAGEKRRDPAVFSGCADAADGRKDKTMKRIWAALAALVLAVGLFGCAQDTQPMQYRAEFYDTFDTVVIVIAYAPDEAAFADIESIVYDTFLETASIVSIFITIMRA